MKVLNERLGEARLPVPEWLCECANTECVVQIPMTSSSTQTFARALCASRSLRATAHVFLDAETVVLQTERFWIVEKFGEAAEAATADGSLG